MCVCVYEWFFSFSSILAFVNLRVESYRVINISMLADDI